MGDNNDSKPEGEGNEYIKLKVVGSIRLTAVGGASQYSRSLFVNKVIYDG